jgi:hypothetical protein
MGYQLSPGVTWSEIDLTTIVPSLSTTAGGFAGDFDWGPVNEVFTVSNELELVRWFGKPSQNTFASFFTAANFLSYAQNLQLVRACDTTKANNATSGNKNILILNKNDYEINYMDLSATSEKGIFAARYPGELGNSIKVSYWASANATSYSAWEYDEEFNGVPGTSKWVEDHHGANDELHIIVVDAGGKISGIPNTVLEKYSYLSKAFDAKNDDGSSNYWVNAVADRSQFIYAINNPAPFSNVANVVVVAGGDHYSNTAANTKGIAVQGGSGVGATVDIRVNVAAGNVVTAIVANNRGTGYLSTDVLSLSIPGGGANGIFTINLQTYPNDWGVQSENKIWNDEGAASYATSRLTDGSVGTPTSSNLIDAYNLFKDIDSVDVSLLMTGNHNKTVCKHVVDNIAEVRKDLVVLLSPQYSDVVNNAGSEANDIVSYFWDTDNGPFNASSYGVIDSGWKKQFDKYSNVYRWVPLNGDIAGLCASTDKNRDPWWSPAGLNRGLIKNVTQLAWSPNQTDRDTLYKNSINPVVAMQGTGTILYGDKTMTNKPSAFDRINVRRLFIVLEKSISRAAKYSLFEFNDEFTRSQFVALVEPFLRDVKGRRGIYEYKVVCDETNNTPEVIDSNRFVGDIYIKPARAINFIQLNFVAVRTGVAFSEIVGKF